MNVFLDMVGCRLNQAEIEQMARQFRAQGHTLVGSAQDAELVVVNTCAVTTQAASDSRQKIRQAARAGAAEVIPTGCWSSLVPAEALALPGVRRVVPNEQKDSLVADLFVPPAGELFDLEPIHRERLPGLRHRTRAFIKVQDGCDNKCTFCITTVARGAGRSRSVADVLLDIQAALSSGTREIILTGVHLGSWGQEMGFHLADLIRAILENTDTPRLRLSSLEPWDLTPDFFSLWQNPRLMPHLHLPLQSGSATVLKRMLRKTTPDSFRELVQAARQVTPEVAITTDVIVGFPGETDAEFEETLAFASEIQFAGGHAFTYSARPGTPAARMKNQVPQALRKERNTLLRDLLQQTSEQYRQGFVGKTVSVLWEASQTLTESGWKMEGWSENYIRVTAFTPDARWNQVDRVCLTGLDGDGMAGSLVQAGIP